MRSGKSRIAVNHTWVKNAASMVTRKGTSPILEVVRDTTAGLRRAGAIESEPSQPADAKHGAATAYRPAHVKLSTFYLSRDRVLGLLDPHRLPPHILSALQGQDVTMASAILSGPVGISLVPP
jgi:hypothetical protein